MKTLILPALAAALFLAAPSTAGAADRDISLRAISMAGDFPGSEVFVHSAGSKQEGTKVTVKTFLNHESDAVTASSDTLILTGKADASSATDKAAVIGEVKLPAGAKSGILLFLPGAKGKPNSVSVIEDDRKTFPPGSTQVVNNTGSELRIEIEGKNFDVKAGGVLVIRDQPVGNNNASMVKGYIKTDGVWAQISSASWPHPGAKRVLQIATENARSGSAELRGVRDISSPR